MADNTPIEWTEATWNPITGCSLASPGCTNCYAMRWAGTRLKHTPSRKGLTQPSKAGPVWTGEVRFNQDELTKPLRWKRPRMIFVCAHGDLFHESVPDAWIDRIFAVMALCPQHTFQVLTKRSGRMREYLSARWQHERGFETSRGNRIASTAALHHAALWVKAKQILPGWPLPNVWLGVSVEDQQRADERIPDLLATPAAVRWISAEPLLGPVDLGSLPWEKSCDCIKHSPTFDALEGTIYCEGCCEGPERVSSQIDWVVVGGESGAKARPMHPDWARALRDQCAAAAVPFFFKQWGSWAPWTTNCGFPLTHWLSKFGRLYEVDDPIAEGQALGCPGKKRAGRLLDGAEHNGMPGHA